MRLAVLLAARLFIASGPPMYMQAQPPRLLKQDAWGSQLDSVLTADAWKQLKALSGGAHCGIGSSCSFLTVLPELHCCGGILLADQRGCSGGGPGGGGI